MIGRLWRGLHHLGHGKMISRYLEVFIIWHAIVQIQYGFLGEYLRYFLCVMYSMKLQKKIFFINVMFIAHFRSDDRPVGCEAVHIDLVDEH